MSDPQPSSPPRQVKPILRCDHCGATYRRLQWTQGMGCPKCKSPDFFPVTIIGGAVDYTLADRSHGYAIEDIRFAQLAKWAGVITPNQYTQALARQRQLAAQAGATPHIAQVMLSEGIMQSAEATAVFQVMCQPRPAEDDGVFATLAVENRLTTPDRVKDCQQVQATMARSRHEVPPLGQIMFEKRFLSGNQVQALYHKMVARKSGVVYEIGQAYEDTRELTAFEKVVGTKDEPERRRSFVLVCVLGVIVLAVWSRWIFGDRDEKMWFKCDNKECGKVYEGKYVDVFPTTCPYCKVEQARYARKCLGCGEVFGTDGWWGRATCPACGMSRVVKYKGK